VHLARGIVRDAGLNGVMIDAATQGSVGSVALRLLITRSGRVHVAVMRTRFLTPEWDPEEPGELLRVIVGMNYTDGFNGRDFYQQFMNPDGSFNGIDSTQRQLNDSHDNSVSVRVNYDKPFNNYKTFLSVGSYYTRNNSHPVVNYFSKPDSVYLFNDLLSNDFRFHQGITNYRASLKQFIVPGFSVMAGTSMELDAVLGSS